MRIVSGIYGGRKLNVPTGRDVRPTSDKIRGAVFNMLSSRDAIEGAYVLDAYCGTGALGLEALSRGAAHVTFFDKARSSLDLAKSNANMLGAENIQFQIKDSSKLSQKPGDIKPYNLIFLDPPYHKEMVEKSLLGLVAGGWIADDAWIMCESERGLNISLPDGFYMDTEKTYGDIQIVLIRTML